MSEIKKRVLGRTGVEVSEVGFGGAPLGEAPCSLATTLPNAGRPPMLGRLLVL